MKINGVYHQGCTINGYYCKLNKYYNDCKDCIKYKPKLNDPEFMRLLRTP